MSRNSNYGSRAWSYAVVKRLRDEGLLQREIAEATGLSRSYVSELLIDPDGTKEVERKDGYRKPCPDCGALMSGSDGVGEAAPKHCPACAPAYLRIWTRETILEAFRLFEARHGRRPVATEWNSRESRAAGYPTLNSVYGVSGPFESWADAVEAAGYARPYQGMRPRRATMTNQLKRPYLVFRENDDGALLILGETEQSSTTDAVEALADAPGRYAAVATGSLQRLTLASRLVATKIPPRAPQNVESPT